MTVSLSKVVNAGLSLGVVMLYTCVHIAFLSPDQREMALHRVMQHLSSPLYWNMLELYIYMFVSFERVCLVYVVKEVTSFRGLGQLMGLGK